MNRRGFLTGLGAALVAAPAIVRAGSLMPVKTMIEPVYFGWDLASGPDYTAMYFYDGVRMLKSINGSDWVDVSSEYYERPPFEGSIGEYQGIRFR